jgi:hypothetical protein
VPVTATPTIWYPSRLRGVSMQKPPGHGIQTGTCALPPSRQMTVASALHQRAEGVSRPCPPHAAVISGRCPPTRAG